MKKYKSELETVWEGKLFPKISLISVDIEGDTFQICRETEGRTELLLERQISEIVNFSDGKIVCKDGEEIFLSAIGLGITGVLKLKRILIPDYISEWSHSQFESNFPIHRTNLFDLESISADIQSHLSGFREIKFELYKSKLIVEYSEGADLATTIKAKKVGDVMRFEVPIESTMSFEIVHLSGEVLRTTRTKIKKEVRAGAFALFPVLPLLAIATPMKKISVTDELVDDERVYELRMSGKGWQFLLPLGTGWPEGIDVFRGELAKAVISSGQVSSEKRSPISNGSSGSSHLKDLEKLVGMLEKGLISKVEYQRLKKNLLKDTNND